MCAPKAGTFPLDPDREKNITKSKGENNELVHNALSFSSVLKINISTVKRCLRLVIIFTTFLAVPEKDADAHANGSTEWHS